MKYNYEISFIHTCQPPQNSTLSNSKQRWLCESIQAFSNYQSVDGSTYKSKQLLENMLASHIMLLIFSLCSNNSSLKKCLYTRGHAWEDLSCLWYERLEADQILIKIGRINGMKVCLVHSIMKMNEPQVIASAYTDLKHVIFKEIKKSQRM